MRRLINNDIIKKHYHIKRLCYGNSFIKLNQMNNNIQRRTFHNNIILSNSNDNNNSNLSSGTLPDNNKDNNNNGNNNNNNNSYGFDTKKGVKLAVLLGGLFIFYKGEIEPNWSAIKKKVDENLEEKKKNIRYYGESKSFLLSRTDFTELKKTRHIDVADEGGLNTGLTKEHYISCKLKNVVPYNHDTNIYQFELTGGDEAEVFLQPGSYVTFDALIDGKHVVRPYTPINTAYSRTLDFLIKKYPDGKMSQHVASLKPGDEIHICGPHKKPGIYPNTGSWDLAMIAGGTGITPMLQIMYNRVGNGVRMGPDSDNNRLTLVYANKTYNDILLRDWLDQLAGIFSPEHDLRLIHVLSEDVPESGDKGRDMVSYGGHINVEMLKEILPKPAPKTRIYVCGPPSMMKAVCGSKGPKGSQGELDGMLKELGYSKEMVYKI